MTAVTVATEYFDPVLSIPLTKNSIPVTPVTLNDLIVWLAEIPVVVTVPQDIVVLPTQGFTKLPYEGEEYWVGPENQILAKINK